MANTSDDISMTISSNQVWLCPADKKNMKISIEKQFDFANGDMLGLYLIHFILNGLNLKLELYVFLEILNMVLLKLHM